MAMTYDQLNTYIQTLVVDQAPSADYVTIFPAAIQDAENRIYRDLDFVATRTVQSPTNFITGNRDYTLPTSNVTILVVQGISVVTPVGQSFGTGKATPLEPVSLDYIDSCFPDPSVQGVPTVWAQKDDKVVTVGQTPDNTYNVAITGTFRPTPMASNNQTTYIGNTYPDLLVAAVMYFITGYQKNYGAQSDDPKMAMSWESTYQARMVTTLAEEQRRKGQGVGWSPFSKTPDATPPRT